MFPRSKRLRNETGARKVLEMPLRRTLRLPSPEDPAGMCLISIELSLDIVFQIDLIDLLHAIDSASIFAITVPMIRGIRERVVISSTLPEPVQPFRAIGLRPRPFAYDGPLVGRC